MFVEVQELVIKLKANLCEVVNLLKDQNKKLYKLKIKSGISNFNFF